MGKINLTIDGRSIEVDEGKTVLEAAREAGIKIPTVCDHKDLTPYGACRMCIVEIEGVRGFPTSCTTPATQGMVVKTQSEEIQTLRNRILELMLSGHPNACLVCNHRELCEKYRPKATKAGRTTRCGFCSNKDECSVREMALEVKERDLDLPTLYSAHNLERDDPFMDRDYNLCILCGRCWRICEKIHGTPAISIINRGKWARIGTSFHKSHVDSGCTFCGSCIDICPTGTLSDRYARWYGKQDRVTLSTCTICPEGCSLNLLTKTNQTIATRMTAFDSESSLCALGRFGYAQIVNASERLRRPMIKEDGEQIATDWGTALASASEGLGKYAGSIAVLVSESVSREDRFLYEKFVEAAGGKLGFVPSARSGEALQPEELRSDIESGKIKAAVVAGDFLSEGELRKLDFVVVVDCFPSEASRAADVVLPAAVLSEIEGTFKNAAGEVKGLTRASSVPGQARPEWVIVSAIARAMGFNGFDYTSAREITPQISQDRPPTPFEGNPRHNVKELPTRFRGHHLADSVPSLEAFGMPVSRVKEQEEQIGEGFEVLEKREIVPNMHLFRIRAPQIAKHAKPGQFVILMIKETSERAPFTLIDWNADEGSITLVMEEVGRSSREAVALKPGSKIAHVSGPLGLPFPIENKGTVVLGGGCYGVGAIYPIARALKEAGNRVICALEASSHYLLYMEDEVRSVCDELRIATKDGSLGIKGGVQEIFTEIVESGTKVDMFVAIGCTFMMRMASEATKRFGIPTFVALNPIMVDGTGMCGACRVTIDGGTRFACVDGPIFDGHQVDWDELFSRRGAYAIEEVEALPQMPVLLDSGHHHGSGGCGCGSSGSGCGGK
jgi:NAD(P)H-flavin reductase/ferredoxin